MPILSFERLLKFSRLAVPSLERDAFVVDRSIRLTTRDSDRLEGRVEKARGVAASSAEGQLSAFTKKLRRRLKRDQKWKSKRDGTALGQSTPHFDRRQRAVAKIHYFNHSSGGARALKLHGKYIARDAGREIHDNAAGAAQERPAAPAQLEPDPIDRHGESAFYDKNSANIDGATQLDAWAKSDLRHFRIILSAEEGIRLRDLQAYTREVMARAGAALGTELSWVAVDHHDTDNPHTHIVVRGRRANGQDLVLPRDFIKHGFRGIAQDVATEWLGVRTPDHERLAYEREVRRHAPTKLDRIIAACEQNGTIHLSRVAAPNGDPILTQAVKARVRELARMGLIEDRGGGLFELPHDWLGRLSAMERHLDIRKRVLRERVERNVQRQPARAPRKDWLDR